VGYRRIPLVWLIYPNLQKVRVIRPEGPPSEFGPDGILTGEEILPGFRCPVSDLFAGPVAARAKSGL
jgi:Uma2 family endonuclease